MGVYFTFRISAIQVVRQFLFLAMTCVLLLGSFASAQQELTPEQEFAQAERQAGQALIKSLLSLSTALGERQKHLKDLNTDLDKAKEEAKKAALETEINSLTQEVLLVQEEIDLIVLGLQSQQFSKESGAASPVDIKKEIGRIFEPIIFSLERATEPARRMEKLRKLSEQAQARTQIARETLAHLEIFEGNEIKYPESVQERLDSYKEIWTSRLKEAEGLSNALNEQLLSAGRVNSRSASEFAKDFGGFIRGRGESILIALGLAGGFILVLQFIRVLTSKTYRKNHAGVLSASMRVFGMALSFIGVLGGFVIAISIFNIRQDWLLLAMSILLALGVGWTFVRSLSTFLEQSRVLLNLGAVREGERTVINGIPYKVERLGVYSKLINPDLKGGELTYPIRELIGMHSRPVTQGEKWFPTKIGDWILRDGSFFEVINQTPEHVVIKKGSGAEDFIPVAEFLGTEFEVISNGYAVVYNFGLGYQHLSDAREIIPTIVNETVKKRIELEMDAGALVNVLTRFVSLGD
ncbi:MAG: hypothetical protein JKX72_03790, partial [Robiginitomaculum sp.]|nr:hypothetical protein [Robiginitomaculum sp.]